MDSGVVSLGSGLCVIVFSVVHKMAADAVGAEANGVECAAGLSLVFRVTAEVSQLFEAMCKLTLAAVFAHTSFGERTAQLGLVA